MYAALRFSTHHFSQRTMTTFELEYSLISAISIAGKTAHPCYYRLQSNGALPVSIKSAERPSNTMAAMSAPNRDLEPGSTAGSSKVSPPGLTTVTLVPLFFTIKGTPAPQLYCESGGSVMLSGSALGAVDWQALNTNIKGNKGNRKNLINNA
jgi:hypothetical protein